MKFDRIVVAWKGAKRDPGLLGVLQRFAAVEAEVRVVHVVDVPRQGIFGDELTQWHDRMVRRISARVTSGIRSLLETAPANSWKVSVVVTEGRPHVEILREAREFGAELIVAGGADHMGLEATTLGTDVGMLAERAPGFLYLSSGNPEIDVVLAPVNFSPLSRRSLSVAATVAEELGVPLVVVHVCATKIPEGLDMSADEWWNTAYGGIMATAEGRSSIEGRLQEFVGDVCGPWTKADVRVDYGAEPGYRIGEIARDFGNALVVMGSLGRSRDSVLVGSTAQRVLRRSRCSILTFKCETVVIPELEQRAETAIREEFEL